ncbi:MAG: aminotransferase class I/II-fold pyridoxal phosphate-dependent enzyme [Acidimicrobiia bacterium]|nr:aminotransferase class I/II-fold pyridoxal phosphate-dependent enzyme [Acidimicrobiia bacterium]
MVSERLQPFKVSVFSEITAAAMEAKAVDLGQGYPSWEGPAFAKDEAIRALAEESNQYPPYIGLEVLRTAIADRWKLDTGMEIDPSRSVTVTSGCTEALSSTFIGTFDPGDEVVLFEPTYDAYPVGCALSGAIPRYVTLHSPDWSIDPDELRDAFSSRTAAILVNTPHNPTGKVFTTDEMQLIADLAKEFGAIVVTDEVYERMAYDREHIRMATLPDMWERTLTLSSIGKSFSLTGWKTGWAIGPERLVANVRSAKQFLTFTTPNPMQWGSAAALRAPESYYDELKAMYLAKRDRLVDGLAGLGFGVRLPEGAYYVLADHTGFGIGDDVDFVRHLISEVGVAAIPPSAFYHSSDEGKRLVRFAFCKSDEVLDEALSRLSRL